MNPRDELENVFFLIDLSETARFAAEVEKEEKLLLEANNRLEAFLKKLSTPGFLGEAKEVFFSLVRDVIEDVEAVTSSFKEGNPRGNLGWSLWRSRGLLENVRSWAERKNVDFGALREYLFDSKIDSCLPRYEDNDLRVVRKHSFRNPQRFLLLPVEARFSSARRFSGISPPMKCLTEFGGG
jgi:hypothetical protein